jgi:hypothetical protein
MDILYISKNVFLTNKFFQNGIAISFIGDYLRLLIAIMQLKLLYNIKNILAFSKIHAITVCR